MKKPKLLNPLERIYLQVGELLEDWEFSAAERTGEVTWCEDQQYDTDVEYRLVRRRRKATPSPTAVSTDQQADQPEAIRYPPNGLCPCDERARRNNMDGTPDQQAAHQPDAVLAFCGPFPEQSEDERTLRRLLALAYAGSGELYGDDGELQLGGFPHPIDFRRMSVAEIEKRIHARGMAKLVEQMRAARALRQATPQPEAAHHDLCASHYWNYTHKAQAAMQAAGEWPPACNCRTTPDQQSDAQT